MCFLVNGVCCLDTSYDDTVSFSRPRDDDSGMYELVQRLEFRGAVEGLAFAKVRWELFHDVSFQLVSENKFT